MARSTLAAALLLAGLAVGATACDTSPRVPAPVTVPSVPGGAPVPPAEEDDDGGVDPLPAGGQEDGDDGADDGPDGAEDDG